MSGGGILKRRFFKSSVFISPLHAYLSGVCVDCEPIFEQALSCGDVNEPRLTLCLLLQGAVEPMQIDVDPQEDQQNAPDINYVVENPTLVCTN